VTSAGETADPERLIARARTDMVPLPIVLDADVLHRNVDYCLRTGYTPKLLEAASASYSLLSGVVVFATGRVREEVERQLVEIAERRNFSLSEVTALWERLFLPRIRFVEIGDRDIEDPRVDEVRALHNADAPTAALAVLLAPCVLLSDNRKHFAPLRIAETRTDLIAVNARELAGYYGSLNAMTLLPTVTGALVLEGSKKVVSSIGSEMALVLAALLIGAGVALWLSEPGSEMREGLKRFAREVGPPLAAAATRALVLSEEMSALAIDPPEQQSAARLIAKVLATRQTVLSTSEIAGRLEEHGYRFAGGAKHATSTRRWLTEQNCFVEQQRGRWTLGYHASEARARRLDPARASR
jgi:hypothetical protein